MNYLLYLLMGAAVQVKPLLKTSQSWDAKPLVYPSGAAEVSMLEIEIPPGAETGWHQHPVPSFAYVVAGELEVSLKDGKKKLLKSGDSFAEVVDTLHNGRNLGKEAVKLLVLYTGVVGKDLTIKPGP